MPRDPGWAREAARGDGQSPPQTRGHTRRAALTVRRSPTGYVLHDPDLHRLAGFDAVPLPFTPEADPAEVLAHLRRLNPHRPVHLDDSSPPDTPSLPPDPRADGAPASLHPQASAASGIPHPS